MLSRVALPMVLVVASTFATTVTSLAAQTTTRDASDSARRAVYRAYLDFGDLVSGGRVVPNWIPGGSSFWYAEGGPQDRVLQRVDPATRQKVPLLDVARLRSALTERLGHEPAGRGVPFERLSFVGPSRVQFELEGRSWRLDLASYALERLRVLDALDYNRVTSSERIRTLPQQFWQETLNGLGEWTMLERPSPDSRWFLGAQDYNLALRAAVDGRTDLRTRDGTKDVQWMVETQRWNPWSPSGTRFLASKTDTRAMRTVHSIQWLKPLTEVLEVLWTRAGGRLAKEDYYVVDVVWGTPVHLDLGETEDHYLVFMGWLPDESRLLVAKYNRLMNRVEIYAADPTTGAAKIIATEESKTYITTQHEVVWGVDFPFTMLPDGKGFIWRSERDGFDHLYRYDANGTLVTRLTQGSFPVMEVVRVDQAGDWVYFYAHGDPARPYDQHLYRVSLAGGKMQQLTDGAGQHVVAMSPAADYFVDVYSTVGVPPVSEVRKSDGTRVLSLGSADVSRLQRVGWVPPREFVVKAADGTTDLWVTMFFPFDFDSTKKYPVVEYLYAGPQLAVRPASFDPGGATGATYSRALANLGFIVLTLDGRGTPGRSKAFHDVIYRNWGKFEIADHAGAIRQLGARLPFIDLTRVGIWGRSWGGHYAVRALAQAPDLYSAASSEVPGLDPAGNQLYEIYLGMPQDNAALYDAANAILLAPKVRGHLRLMSGLNDVATFPEFAKMSEALVRLGFQHEVSVFANSGHPQFGQTAIYNDEQRTEFFVRYLRP